MHVRFSTVIGLPIVEDSNDEEIASVSDILIDPDKGKIEGFFVQIPSFFHVEELFLSVADIIHWGNIIRVRDAGVLSPLDELVRLQSLHEQNRPLLRQKIMTEAGRYLGVCRDVQFDTKLFMLEWIFPRRFWRWGIPLSASSIVQVRLDAIIVRDSATIPEPIAESPSVLETLDPLTNTASRVIQDSKHS